MIDSAHWGIDTNPSYTWPTGHTHHSVDSHWSFLPISKVEKHGGCYVGGRFLHIANQKWFLSIKFEAISKPYNCKNTWDLLRQRDETLRPLFDVIGDKPQSWKDVGACPTCMCFHTDKIQQYNVNSKSNTVKSYLHPCIHVKYLTGNSHKMTPL